MRNVSLFFLLLGLGLMTYAIFSRFYGEAYVAMKQFKSVNFLILANTVLLISLIIAHHHHYKL
jgi:xanthine/uracil permease